MGLYCYYCGEEIPPGQQIAACVETGRSYGSTSMYGSFWAFGSSKTIHYENVWKCLSCWKEERRVPTEGALMDWLVGLGVLAIIAFPLVGIIWLFWSANHRP